MNNGSIDRQEKILPMSLNGIVKQQIRGLQFYFLVEKWEKLITPIL